MRSEELVGRINALPRMDVKLMEVCGTHTMSIARAGIRRLLPEGVDGNEVLRLAAEKHGIYMAGGQDQQAP